MFELILAAAGIALLWLAGALCLVAIGRQASFRCGPLLAAAYGWPLGVIVIILWMSLLALLGLRFSVWNVAALPALLTLGAAWRCRTGPPRLAALAAAPTAPGWRALTPWAQWLWWGFFALLLVRGLFYLGEILWRPTFGWDAWAHWATKAKVWYSLGSIVSFGGAAEMLAGSVPYTDGNPGYPRGVPLLQVWMALCVGTWDDTLVNLPWFAFALALALGFYAQVRAAGGGPLFAMGVTYLLGSLPFIGVHIALPGYADLPLAAFVGLASFAFWRWSVDREWAQLALAFSLALASPLLKTPGWIWFALFLPAALPILLGKLGWRILWGTAAAALAGLVVLANYHPRVMGYELHTSFQPVWGPLVETLFIYQNWHLLGLTTLLLVASSWRELARPRMAALSVYLAGGFGFLFVVFFFSNAAIWVRDLSTVNRALLHLVPTLVFYCTLLMLQWRRRLEQIALPPKAAEPKPNTEP